MTELTVAAASRLGLEVDALIGDDIAVELFGPSGVSPPGVSPSGFSSSVFSASGFSASGFSASGASASGSSSFFFLAGSGGFPSFSFGGLLWPPGVSLLKLSSAPIWPDELDGVLGVLTWTGSRGFEPMKAGTETRPCSLFLLKRMLMASRLVTDSRLKVSRLCVEAGAAD